MSKELKRVPLDFKWPINQIWKGFINPFSSIPCKPCDETGLNPATKYLNDTWYGIGLPERWVWVNEHRRYNDNAWSNHLTELEIEALVRGGRLSDCMDAWYNFKDDHWEVLRDRSKGWEMCDQPIFPTPETVNNWNRTCMGHDSINRSIAVKARAKSLGVYGYCEFCNGDGEIWQSEDIKKLSDEWKEFEPPAGDGYQLWEDVSEGSPQSPVFKTLEELCAWCEDNASTFANFKTSKEEWFKMLSGGFVSHQEGNMIFL